jgi:hypothetical protein
MNILFVMERRIDAGSIQALGSYISISKKLGHTIAIYGNPDAQFSEIHFSNNLRLFDYVVFIFESKLNCMSGLQLAPLLTMVPRARRVILDADGMYNPVIDLDGYDRNHANERDRQQWVSSYEMIADRIVQPTPCPRQSRVKSLLFYGYDPKARMAHTSWQAKGIDIMHVGHNWWRWREISERLLPALEHVREDLGEICFIGSWWDAPPGWAAAIGQEKAFGVDSKRLRQLGIRILPAVPFRDVISTMSAARINIMTQRPLFQRLGLVTSKYFEIFSADTLPLVMMEPEHAQRIYGPSGKELVLHGDIGGKLIDVLKHPSRYLEAVQAVRRHLITHHSYERRLYELVEMLDRHEPASRQSSRKCD